MIGQIKMNTTTSQLDSSNNQYQHPAEYQDIIGIGPINKFNDSKCESKKHTRSSQNSWRHGPTGPHKVSQNSNQFTNKRHHHSNNVVVIGNNGRVKRRCTQDGNGKYNMYNKGSSATGQMKIQKIYLSMNNYNQLAREEKRNKLKIRNNNLKS